MNLKSQGKNLLVKRRTKITLEPIKKRRIPDEILSRINMLVDSGVLQHGSKLPPERELAKMLQVSRPSLREALRALSLLGIITNHPGSGTFISSSSSLFPREAFSLLFAINKKIFIDLIEARKAIEGAIAKLAAKNRTKKDLSSLTNALESMKNSLHNPDLFNKYEIEFHEKIIAASQNVILREIMGKLGLLLRQSREEWIRYTKDLLEELYKKHYLIFKYIKQKDKKRAMKAMIDHLEFFEKIIRGTRHHKNKGKG